MESHRTDSNHRPRDHRCSIYSPPLYQLSYGEIGWICAQHVRSSLRRARAKRSDMRHPGIEPGPPRWQRGIITTRLMTLWLGSETGRWHSGRPGRLGGSRSQKRSPAVATPRTDLHGFGSAVLPLTAAGAFPCSVAGLRRFTPHYATTRPTPARKPRC